ncbi:MAG TPA: NTP transferase domain-containing protein [Polyangia bacterium]|nr:NTP transferase domain-containing protein [Polyangia bacterium]
MPVTSTVAAAIIAGGRARRLGGAAKPFLEVDGVAIADRQLAVLRPLFGRIIAVVADAADAAVWRERGVETVTDAVAGAGPLAGVAAALAAAAPGAVVCVAGDLPFLSPALLAALRDRDPEAGAIAAKTAGGQVEPLCARYGPRCLAELQTRLAAGRLALHALLAETEGTVWLRGEELAALDPGGRSFLNVNTPEDLARADRLARGGG